MLRAEILQCSFANNVLLVFDCTYKEFIKHINDKYKVNFHDQAKTMAGRALSFLDQEHGVYLFFMWVDTSMEAHEVGLTVTHEATHMTEQVLASIRTPLNEHTGEVYAYLHEDLTSQILKYLNIKFMACGGKKKKKKGK